MNIDPTLDEALAKAGVKRSELGALLRLTNITVPDELGDAHAEPELAEAVGEYLESVPSDAEVGTADLATAILISAQKGARGRLSHRLKELRVNYPVAFAALKQMGAHAPVQSEKEAPPQSGKEAPEPDEFGEFYSRSVRRARNRLGARATVTPARIAAAIQQDHPEYANEMFGHTSLRPSAGPTATVEKWLERVRGLYDSRAVAESRHKVITGELTVLGLAELDDSLSEDLKVDGLLNSWRRSVAILPRHTTSERTDWTSDEPAEKDLLGRAYLAQVLAMKLRALRKMTESFLIHVDGPWGSGKSTLFRLLKKELECVKEEPEGEITRDKCVFLVIEINAWREQEVGVQWWTLHSALRQAVEDDSAHRYSAKVLSRIHVIRTRLFPFVVAMLVLITGVVGLALLANFDFQTGGKIADAVSKIVSLLVLSLAGITAAYRFLLPESHRSAKGFVSTSANPMWEVRRLFARTLKRTKKSVVFLIDDLDRCDPAYIVEFLGTVQTLVRDAPQSLRGFSSNMRAPGPYAVVAADGQWIRSSYENHYSSVRIAEVPGRPLGYQFLEKIFQLQVRLPSITEETKQAFYESLLTQPRSSESLAAEQERLVEQVKDEVRQATNEQELAKAAKRADQITNAAQRMEVRGTAAVKYNEVPIQESIRHDLAPYGKFLEPNPRSIRLFVNTYTVLRSLRTLEGITVPTRSLALWTVVEIRWPLLADHLRVHPDDIDPQAGTKPPESTAELLRSAEVQAVIVNPGEGPLTPSDVRDCTGRSAQHS